MLKYESIEIKIPKSFIILENRLIAIKSYKNYQCYQIYLIPKINNLNLFENNCTYKTKLNNIRVTRMISYLRMTVDIAIKRN